jgi:hypothetical protein
MPSFLEELFNFMNTLEPFQIELITQIILNKIKK